MKEKPSKHLVTLVTVSHTKPINHQKITDFLLELTGGTVQVVTYKNATIDNDKSA